MPQMWPADLIHGDDFLCGHPLRQFVLDTPSLLPYTKADALHYGRQGDQQGLLKEAA